MPIIKPRGLLKGDRVKELSDEAKLYWPWLYAGSNGYGRFQVNYEEICRRCFSQFNMRPAREVIKRVMEECRDHHLLFFYRASNGQIWAAWDSAATQQHHSAEDLASPVPPEPEFQKWKDSYRDRKNKAAEENSKDDFADDFAPVKNPDEDARRNYEKSSTSITEEAVSCIEAEVLYKNSEICNEKGEFYNTPPSLHQTSNIKTSKHQAPHEKVTEIPKRRNSDDFWFEYTGRTNVPVNESDREETEKEWNTLSFKEQFDGFQWVIHNLPDNRAPAKYWLPQNFLKKKMWTRLGMGRAQYRAPIDDDRPLVGVQVPMR